MLGDKKGLKMINPCRDTHHQTKLSSPCDTNLFESKNDSYESPTTQSRWNWSSIDLYTLQSSRNLDHSQELTFPYESPMS